MQEGSSRGCWCGHGTLKSGQGTFGKGHLSSHGVPELGIDAELAVQCKHCLLYTSDAADE